jgi:hypothetical protein
MRLRGSLSLVAVAALVSACASSIQPEDGAAGDVSTADGAADRVTPPSDRVTPPSDAVVPPSDVVVPPGEDVVVPPGEDVVVPPMDVVVPPGEDVVVPPMDAVVPPMDVVVPPADVVVPPADAAVDVPMGPVCPAAGLNENCPPAGSMGACTALTAGTRTINFAGLTSGIAASCEGMQTSMGPDGVVPLVITATSDVTIRVEPFGSGAVTASIFNSTGCGVLAQQRGCVNTNGGGPVTLNASNLTPGTYWVQFSAAAGSGGALPLANITTTIMPSPVRLPGDTCPGVMVPTDGTPATLSTAMFSRAGTEVTTTGCTNIGSNLDAVFSFSIAETSDVNVDVLGPSGSVQALNMDIQNSCGSAMLVRSDLTCTTNNAASISRMIRRLSPGTYFIVTQARAGMTAPSSLIARVTATRSAPTGPADMCPGIPISAGMPAVVPVTSLAQDLAFACFPASSADANFSFNAPMGNDVLIEAFAGNNRVGIELQEPCGMNSMSCTAPGTTGRAWRRYAGLTAGRSYTAHVGTNAASGNLEVTYRSIPALTTTPIAANEACATARTIPATGGVFTGNTAMMGANTSAPFFGNGACQGCNSPNGRDAVYRLDLTARTRVLATLRGSTMGFDPLLYVRGGMTCVDNIGGGGFMGTAFCADDYFGQDSGFDRTLDPGTYWFYVDACAGFGGGGGVTGGAYSLEVITLTP